MLLRETKNFHFSDDPADVIEQGIFVGAIVGRIRIDVREKIKICNQCIQNAKLRSLRRAGLRRSRLLLV